MGTADRHDYYVEHQPEGLAVEIFRAARPHYWLALFIVAVVLPIFVAIAKVLS